MIENFKSAINYNEGINFSSVMNKVFFKMFMGLLVTALAAYITFATGLYVTILSSSFFTFGIAIVEIGLVVYLSSRILKMNSSQASFWYYTYAVLNGITMAYIFAMFQLQIVFLAFACTSAMFGITALYGYTTKKDLSSLGSVGTMLLLGIIITTFLNIFLFKSAGLDLFLLYAGLAVFAGITAYDIQKIKEMSNMVDSSENNIVNAVATMGALMIYMDFINIFIRLLSIFSRRND